MISQRIMILQFEQPPACDQCAQQYGVTNGISGATSAIASVATEAATAIESVASEAVSIFDSIF